MIILLDTNIVLDVLLKRNGYEDAVEVMKLAYDNLAIEFVTASSVTDIFYMLTSNRIEQKLKTEDAQEKIFELLQIVDVAPVTKKEILEALAMKWNDFEDAVQYVVAKASGADYIITRDSSGFANSDIEALSPSMFRQEVIDAGKLSL